MSYLEMPGSVSKASELQGACANELLTRLEQDVNTLEQCVESLQNELANAPGCAQVLSRLPDNADRDQRIAALNAAVADRTARLAKAKAALAHRQALVQRCLSAGPPAPSATRMSGLGRMGATSATDTLQSWIPVAQTLAQDVGTKKGRQALLQQAIGITQPAPPPPPADSGGGMWALAIGAGALSLMAAFGGKGKGAPPRKTNARTRRRYVLA